MLKYDLSRFRPIRLWWHARLRWHDWWLGYHFDRTGPYRRAQHHRWAVFNLSGKLDPQG